MQSNVNTSIILMNNVVILLHSSYHLTGWLVMKPTQLLGVGQVDCQGNGARCIPIYAHLSIQELALLQ